MPGVHPPNTHSMSHGGGAAALQIPARHVAGAVPHPLGGRPLAAVPCGGTRAQRVGGDTGGGLAEPSWVLGMVFDLHKKFSKREPWIQSVDVTPTLSCRSLAQWRPSKTARRKKCSGAQSIPCPHYLHSVDISRGSPPADLRYVSPPPTHPPRSTSRHTLSAFMAPPHPALPLSDRYFMGCLQGTGPEGTLGNGRR